MHQNGSVEARSVEKDRKQSEPQAFRIIVSLKKIREKILDVCNIFIVTCDINECSES